MVKLRNIVLIMMGFFVKSKKSKVIYYHDVHNSVDKKFTIMSTHISMFDMHIHQLKKNKFDIVKEIKHSDHQILIGFDDGYRGIYENKDFFIKNKIPIEVYIITSKIGENGFLNEKEILELHDSGFFSFYAHTHYHNELPKLSDLDLLYDLKLNKQILEKLLKKEVNKLCFPKGLFSKKVIELAKEAGFEELYCSIPGNYFDKNKWGVTPRNLTQNENKIAFLAILHGALNLFKKHYENSHITN